MTAFNVELAMGFPKEAAEAAAASLIPRCFNEETRKLMHELCELINEKIGKIPKFEHMSAGDVTIALVTLLRVNACRDLDDREFIASMVATAAIANWMKANSQKVEDSDVPPLGDYPGDPSKN